MRQFPGSRKWAPILVVVLLTAAYVAVRLLDLDRIVTNDEPFWLGRSANFYRALRTGDLAHTYQMAHPGVLTMWAGAAAFAIRAPDYASLAPGNVEWVYFIDGVLRERGIDPLDLLITARVCKIALQALFFAFAVRYLLRLVPRPAAILAAALIVFQPFLTGHDSALHVDGLFAISCFAALLAIVSAAPTFTLETLTVPGLWPWVVAGMLSACAWLTRATGLFLVAMVGVVLLGACIVEWRASGRSVIRRSVALGLVWLGSAAVTTFLLLPALWVAPRSTLGKLWDWTRQASAEGHEHPTFFMGEIHYGDPGWAFYPVAIAWRTTPVEWLGLVALVAVVPFLLRRRPADRTLLLLIVVCAMFVVGYVTAMSIGAKKFDRYVLPVFPVICLLAAIGLTTSLDALRRWWRVQSRTWMAGVIVIAVLVQFAMFQTTLPYRMDFYTPLLGGASRAEDVLQLGWGEGGVEVVEYLDAHANEDQPIVVQTFAIPSTAIPAYFKYFLFDKPYIRFASFGLDTPAAWFETDYYVAGIQQTQRDMVPEYHLFQRFAPVHAVEIGGVAYFEIFAPKQLPLPEQLQKATACDMTFGGTLRLMQIVERDDAVDLYWQTVGAETVHPVTIAVELIAPDGASRQSTVVLDPAPPGGMSRAHVELPVAGPDASPGQHRLVISATDVASGVKLLATRPWDAQPRAEVATTPSCYDEPPPSR